MLRAPSCSLDSILLMQKNTKQCFVRFHVLMIQMCSCRKTQNNATCAFVYCWFNSAHAEERLNNASCPFAGLCLLLSLHISTCWEGESVPSNAVTVYPGTTPTDLRVLLKNEEKPKSSAFHWDLIVRSRICSKSKDPASLQSWFVLFCRKSTALLTSSRSLQRYFKYSNI